jgi:hypothetical protein
MLFPIDIHFLSTVSRDIAVSRMGIDIGAPAGTPAVAVTRGAVCFSGPVALLGDRLIARLEIDAALAGVCLVRLDQPVSADEREYRFAWYGNLGRLDHQPDQTKKKIDVREGQRLGRVGSAGGMSYLNFGLLTDNGGCAGEPMSKQRLYAFIWQEAIAAYKSLIPAS